MLAFLSSAAPVPLSKSERSGRFDPFALEPSAPQAPQTEHQKSSVVAEELGIRHPRPRYATHVSPQIIAHFESVAQANENLRASAEFLLPPNPPTETWILAEDTIHHLFEHPHEELDPLDSISQCGSPDSTNPYTPSIFNFGYMEPEPAPPSPMSHYSSLTEYFYNAMPYGIPLRTSSRAHRSSATRGAFVFEDGSRPTNTEATPLYDLHSSGSAEPLPGTPDRVHDSSSGESSPESMSSELPDEIIVYEPPAPGAPTLHEETIVLNSKTRDMTTTHGNLYCATWLLYEHGRVSTFKSTGPSYPCLGIAARL
ncbi:hypothetical protein BOTBODRAFT_190295 [Botryobasidium botryosum FD-172 SS1]|uniref:Uncharacterized protein n=1 Tax=Botryobasidium botryosum (strain FD-172 SS1) TaxID=930990 RepID=A0A067M4Y6_BOTB1|nr:hypothetical protein BOTBODRAFT_190295 [Botryobasidium botryosum FD-172 SS1]